MSDIPELNEVRTAIDELDRQIVGLLAERKELQKHVALIKEQLGNIPAHQPERFAQMMDALHDEADKLGVDRVLIDNIWDAIHEQSMSQQNAHQEASK